MNGLSLCSPTAAPSHQGGQQHNQAPLASPDYQREAQQIVREEREQREKMPNYPVSGQEWEGTLKSMLTETCCWHLFQGLEGFKLVEKMGDGAFSNVYKAIDRTSGQKVAGKFQSLGFHRGGLFPDCDVTHHSQGRQEVRAQCHSSESRSFSQTSSSFEAGPPAGSRGKSILGEETWVSRKCAFASYLFLPCVLSHLRDS